eukprot:TRINITY_DN534_c0_g1_i1.p1 TRINITY_DN534_c0_g1~~TRINITY_DN534_c0_g1_i1.p1  ORF type:complete len:486 (-),score=198.47 TRINITY_DN534_c0_g1_i1:48-1475(-)
MSDKPPIMKPKPTLPNAPKPQINNNNNASKPPIMKPKPQMNGSKPTKPNAPKPQMNGSKPTKPNAPKPQMNGSKPTKPNASKPQINALKPTLPNAPKPQINNNNNASKPPIMKPKPQMNGSKPTLPNTPKPNLPKVPKPKQLVNKTGNCNEGNNMEVKRCKSTEDIDFSKLPNAPKPPSGNILEIPLTQSAPISLDDNIMDDMMISTPKKKKKPFVSKSQFLNDILVDEKTIEKDKEKKEKEREKESEDDNNNDINEDYSLFKKKDNKKKKKKMKKKLTIQIDNNPGRGLEEGDELEYSLLSPKKKGKRKSKLKRSFSINAKQKRRDSISNKDEVSDKIVARERAKTDISGIPTRNNAQINHQDSIVSPVLTSPKRYKIGSKIKNKKNDKYEYKKDIMNKQTQDVAIEVKRLHKIGENLEDVIKNDELEIQDLENQLKQLQSMQFQLQTQLNEVVEYRKEIYLYISQAASLLSEK